MTKKEKAATIAYKLDVDNKDFNAKIKQSTALVEKLERTIKRIKLPK